MTTTSRQPKKDSINIHFICLILLFGAPALLAEKDKKDKNQVVDPVLFDGMKYRSVGPSRGGRATAIAGVPQKPFSFYMGPTGGGVW